MTGRYLGRLNKNGDAIYMAADGKLSAMVDAKAAVVPPTSRPASTAIGRSWMSGDRAAASWSVDRTK